jgi:energy-converting hydrogenase A subunit M
MMDKEFFPVELVVGGVTYTIDYRKELKCSEETINDDLKDQPSFFAWYAVLSEVAQAEMAEAKTTLEMAEAVLDERIRKESAGDKVTETMVKNRIRLDPTFQGAQENFATARKNVGILGAIKESFYHRKDVLISLASNMRVQADPSIYIKKQEFAKP